jgi:tetratricopeptide (TPR) repeat protein
MGSRLGLAPELAAAVFEAGRAAADDPRARALISLGYGRFLALCLGDVQSALELSQEALSVACAAGDRDIEVAARLLRSPFLSLVGKLREAVAIAAPVLEGSPEAAEVGAAAVGFSPYPFLLSWRGSLLAALGRPVEGLADVERALDLARARPSAELMGWCQLAAANVELTLGNPAAALSHARAALAHPGTASVPGLQSYCQNALGAAHLADGRWDEALEALERSLALIRETSTGRIREVSVLGALAEAHLGRGDLERARAFAHEAQELAQARLARLAEIDVDLVLARLALREGGAGALGEAQAALVRADARIDETEARALAPRVCEVRAELCRALGDVAAADRHLREAQRLYAGMGAARHTARLAEALGRHP